MNRVLEKKRYAKHDIVPEAATVKKTDLKIFTNFTGKHLCRSLFFSLFFNKGFLLKERLRHKCFIVNFAKFLRTPFLQDTSERLLLIFQLKKVKSKGKCLVRWQNCRGNYTKE